MLTALTIVIGMALSPAAAGLQNARQNPLTSITGLRCHFSLTTSVVWKDGKPDVRVETIDSRLTISDINIQDGSAEISGPAGRRFAPAVLSDGSLYFMDTGPGALEMTTVFAVESSPGKLKAVRAHHAYVFLSVPPFPTDPTVSQSYGECEPQPPG